MKRIAIALLLATTLLACNEEEKVTKVAPAASAEEQTRASTPAASQPAASTGLMANELVGSWVRTKVRNATDGKEYNTEADANNFSVKFLSDNTYLSSEGTSVSEGTWHWQGKQLVLDNGRQTLDVLTLGNGHLSWQFQMDGKTWMYSLKSAAPQ